MRLKTVIIALSLVLGCIAPSGQIPEPPPPAPEPAPVPPANQPGVNASVGLANNSKIRIASFNIQVFGESKRSKPQVMEILSKSARNFDIMLVQELRDSTETTLPFYLEQINSLPGPDYLAVSSPRLGRTSSKENYAYVYNPEKLTLLANYTFADPPGNSSPDIFQREPFIARFKSNNGSFDFVLIGIHTDPDEAVQEIDDLALTVGDARARFPGEDDFIILGDLNADCDYFDADEPVSIKNSSFIWIIPDTADTTTRSTDCAYDRIILSESANESYAGEWGVFRFDLEYGLNQSLTLEVSDHYPVWADFNPS